MSETQTTTTLPALRATRGHLKGSLTRLVTYIESISEAISLAELTIRYYKVDDLWKEFSSTQNQLYSFSADENYTDPIPEFEEFEAKVLIVKSRLLLAITDREKEEKKNDVVTQLASQQKILIDTLSQSTSSGRCDENFIPSVRIEPFSGNYREWPTFRDTFKSVVQNKLKLAPVRKFQFLISCLRGEALSLLSHFKICDETYDEAWDKLERRYDRPRHIINSFVQAFMELPSVHGTNVNVLRKISDGADEIVRGLNVMSSLTRDPWVIYILVNKLDPETRQAWSEDNFSEDDPTIGQLLDFLDRRCEALETCKTSTREPSRTKKPIVKSLLASSSVVCPKCKANHNLSQCQEFLDMNVQTRREYVKINKLCFNCLHSGHSSARCLSKFRCKLCNTRHNSLVHDSSINSTSNTNSNSSVSKSLLVHDPNKDFVPQKSTTSHSIEPKPNTSTRSTNLANLGIGNSQNLFNLPSPSLINNHSFNLTNPITQTLLPTALGKVLDVNGKNQQVRILIDTGSQVSFVTESCAQRLGLKRKNARIPICGIGSTNAGTSRGLLSLVISSRCDTYSIFVDTYILSSVTTNLPSISFTIDDWYHLNRLDLADPLFNTSGPIDILLGADKAWDILQGQSTTSTQGYPIAQKTIFGWVLAGLLPCITSHHVCLNIDSLLQSFWTIEEVDPKPFVSAEDRQIEEHFLQTHRRDPVGRYIVDLPFKSPPSFRNTLNGAVSRLEWMEKKFSKSSNLSESYSQFLDEYLALGHMSLIPTSDIAKPNVYYLPHHAVLKPDSSTTKLRVVFDGSFKDTKGTSLNDTLMIGPPIQRNLFSVCLRFRRHQFVFTADIVKMFRQIWVSEQDADFQRIVWRKSPTDPLQHFRLRTVTYGTSCAPFLAVRVLEQLAKDYRNELPIASDIVLNDFYVDDVVSGGDSLSDAMCKRDSLIKLLEKCGMRLSKWHSNCPELRQDPNNNSRQCLSLDTEADPWTKVLGLFWNSESDVFSFRLNYSPENKITKRQILRDIASIFDPLGFLSPSVVSLKILLQNLWQRNVDWDDELPYPILCQWKKYRDELPCLTKVEIPRTIGLAKNDFQLHAFSDASESAYSAVIYSRYMLPDGTFETNILAAKTRVSPLKQLSIPRLELCGAVLLVRLLVAVQKSLNITFENVFAWSDSQVVLSWLSSPPRRWNIFIGNRTSEILDAIPRNRWFHVRTNCNPADCASRGVMPSQLLEHHLWWKGPTWLREHFEKWPIAMHCEDDPASRQEEKKVSSQSFLVVADDHPFESLSTRISSWNILIRTVARIQRIANRCRKECIPSSFHLEPLEIFNAKKNVIKWLQSRYFKDDIKAFNKFGKFPNNSKIINLSPFLDDEGILRVGGRILESDASFNTKHPIIIPRGHIITKLIVLDAHIRFCHPGITTLFALIRQEYWVIGCRNLLRKITHECVKCFRQRKATTNQLMGNLPPQRIQVSRPFAHCGCDYAGPLTLRVKSGRKSNFTKGYISLFVCLVTKCIHLELVSDLTTDAFLAALRRFVARRGKPSHIYTDNGTNFRGSARSLSEMHQLLLSQTHNSLVAESLARDGISWHFIPPSSPHFGGLWEAGVKSVKQHLRRVINNDILTYEQLYTLLTQIEAMLNSRPLCQISDTELDPLTPAHFFLGESYAAIPEPIIDVPMNRLSSWQQLQSKIQGYWKRWQMEYLTSLQQRPRWQQIQTNIKVNDLVVIKEANLPPGKWAMGRVLDVHPGKDGHVRVVTLKTANGNFVRPIHKLAVLPCSETVVQGRGNV